MKASVINSNSKRIIKIIDFDTGFLALYLLKLPNEIMTVTGKFKVVAYT